MTSKEIELQKERNVDEEGFLLNQADFKTYFKGGWFLSTILKNDDNNLIPMKKEEVETIHNELKELQAANLFPTITTKLVTGQVEQTEYFIMDIRYFFHDKTIQIELSL